MRKVIYFLLLLLSFVGILNAQNIKREPIKNSTTNKGAPAASVTIKNSSERTYSDDRVGFKINPNHQLPVTFFF